MPFSPMRIRSTGEVKECGGGEPTVLRVEPTTPGGRRRGGSSVHRHSPGRVAVGTTHGGCSGTECLPHILVSSGEERELGEGARIRLNGGRGGVECRVNGGRFFRGMPT